ncbi:hypothetical protein [Gordonia aquimaris]|uniref:Uncharacterized protein n=1 Tax=Gordonia aquimaris TaxID=2984863 RepID=A0A9X3I7R6_9ACTN|nr:hypothetical protein [Gordonia aquimaris]MCX2966854.1 hypothetical protein [Gordonia aquimaris]
MNQNENNEWGNVGIRRDGGLIVIASDRPAPPPIHLASIRADGGTVCVDVTDPTTVPTVLLDDPLRARTWLDLVYGTDAADAVARFDDGDAGAPDVAPARQGELFGIVARLGVGYWLHRWWPSGADEVPNIDVGLLDLEIGALAWLAEPLFADLAPIQQLLQPHSRTLVRVIDDLRSTAGSTAHRRLGILTTALRATVDIVAPDSPGYAESVALLDRIDTEDATAADILDATDWQVLDADLAASAVRSARAYAWPELVRTKAGASGIWITPTRSGSSEADWAQLPPRTALARHSNINWTVRHEQGTPWLTVNLDASAQANPAVQLMARSYPADDLASVPDVFALEFDSTRRVFTGRRRLTSVPTSDFVVDVFDPAYMRRPRPSTVGRSAAEHDRSRIIDLIVERARHLRNEGFIAEHVTWENDQS